jgi:GPH family glycoside/pentoside/hexuronide:cation symporter
MESNNNSSPEVTAGSAFADLGGKLPLYEKIGYGFGDTASNIMYHAWGVFLMIFYTDVFGIPAKTAGFMILVTRIWDMINDPMMGMIADRTKTRWGKFRPYLLWMAIPYGVLMYVMFITPAWSQNWKVFYAYATYILTTMAYTAINIPYSSLMAVMTPNPLERTTLSQYRFFLAFAGKLLVSVFTLPLVMFFGANASLPGFDEELGYSQAAGFSRTMGAFGIIAIVFLFITFLTTRERVQPPKDQRSSFRQDLADVSKNLPWIIIFISAIFWLTHNAIRDGMILYYFKYVNGEGSSIVFRLPLGTTGLDFDLTTVFLTIGILGMMTGVLISTPLKKRYGRKMLMIFFCFASVVLGSAFYILPPEDFILLAVMNFLWSAVAGAMPVFLFAMFSDVTDFHEWKFGRRATGLVIAGIMFAIKMGLALGGFLLLRLLDVFGYVANQPQTPEAIRGIKLLFSVIPASFVLVSGIILCFYPINEKLLAKIEVDLKERKSNE